MPHHHTPSRHRRRAAARAAVRVAAATVTALAAAALPARPAAAQTTLPLGSWQLFTYLLGAGSPVEGDGYTLTVGARTRLRVVDAGFTGDRFALFANGVQRLTTGAVSSPGAFTAYLDPSDGDAAWASAPPADLSRGELFLDAGTYRLTLAVAAAGSGFDDGAGFIRADAAPLDPPPPPPPPSVVPEPGSVLLTGAGLAALAGAARRRRATA